MIAWEQLTRWGRFPAEVVDDSMTGLVTGCILCGLLTALSFGFQACGSWPNDGNAHPTVLVVRVKEEGTCAAGSLWASLSGNDASQKRLGRVCKQY